MRVRVRVRPGARRTVVGGRWDGPGPMRPGERNDPALIVAVAAPAVDGRANAAVCEALAAALDLRARDVRIVSGERSRDKVLEVDTGDDAALVARVAALRDR